MPDSDITNETSSQGADAKNRTEFNFLGFAIAHGYDPRVKTKKNTRHTVIGPVVLAYIRASGEEFISTPKGPWLYSAGDWSRCHSRWLAVRIEMACRGFGFHSDAKVIAETRAWLLRQPEVWGDSAPPQERKRSGGD